MFYKMKKTVVIDGKEFAEGSVFELDADTAKKWVLDDRCEETTDPADALYSKVTDAVEGKINAAVEKLADSIKVKTEPIVSVTPENKSLGDFIKLFASGEHEKLTNKYGKKVLSIGTDTAVLPTPMFEEVLRADKGEQDVYSLVRQLPMTSDTLKVPVLNQAGVSPSGGQSSFYGGITFAFDSEDDDANDTEPVFTTATINSGRLTGCTIQTLEFQQDNVYGETQLVEDFRKAYRDCMSYNILQGASSITGLIDHAATVDIVRGTASDITWTDVVSMLARRASVAGNWSWVVSPTAYSKLLELESSGGFPLVQPQLHNSLYGLPIIQTEHCKALGTAGDLLLLNGQMGYVFGNRMQAEISFSDHVGFVKSRRYWKLVARVGGLPVHADTITLADGSTEASDLIQLGDENS